MKSVIKKAAVMASLLMNVCTQTMDHPGVPDSKPVVIEVGVQILVSDAGETQLQKSHEEGLDPDVQIITVSLTRSFVINNNGVVDSNKIDLSKAITEIRAALRRHGYSSTHGFAVYFTRPITEGNITQGIVSREDLTQEHPTGFGGSAPNYTAVARQATN